MPVDFEKKQALAICVKMGESFLSPKTQFVQFDQRITLNHQMYFALALAKTKQKDAMYEAIEMMKKVLPFQNDEGGFPRYLHEYPNSYCRLSCLKMFLALAELIHLGKTVLKTSTLAPWVSALERLENYLKGLSLQKEYALWFSCVESYKNGERLSSNKKEELTKCSFQSAKKCGDHLCFMQALAEEFSKEIEKIHSFYHKTFGYIGPMEEEKQHSGKRILSFLDVFFGCSGEQLDPIFLEGALVESSIQKKREPLFSYENWRIREEKNYIERMSKDAWHLFSQDVRLFFQEKDLDFSGNRGTIHIGKMDPKNPFVAKLFWSDQAKYQCFVNGKKSSMFFLEDVVEIIFPEFVVQVIWKKVSGEGDFTGHFLRGNKPYEMSKERLFDAMMGIRALRCSPNTKLEIQIRILQKEAF